MASNEQKLFLQKFMFKEKEAKLFRFKKDNENPVNIREHLKNVKEFLNLFEACNITTEERIAIFSKYFDETLMKEIKCDPNFDSAKVDIDYLEKHLITLLDIKPSKINQVIPILELIQYRGEKITDFAKRIRMESCSLSEKKEEIMVRAFINGLGHKKLANVLKIFEPKSLEEAVESIKDEKITEDYEMNENVLCNIRQESETIKSLRIEIENLKREIAELRRLNNKSRSPNMFNKNSNNKAKFPETQKWTTVGRQETRTCFTCGKKGHIARDCRTKKCFRCGGDHLIRNCKQTSNLRYYQEEEEEPESVNNEELEEEDCCDQVNAISENKSSWNKQKSTEVIKSLKSSLEDKYVNFIEGNAARPKKILRKYEPTLISMSRPEKARNKPIVECQVAGIPVKTMFDTGADLNVISQELAERICKKNSAVRIFKSMTKVTCANGTTEECLGKVQLNMSIGPVMTAHVFDIMPNIFPHLYIGLRSMKKYEIMVDAANDGIIIQNVKIPFISKTILPESIKN